LKRGDEMELEEVVNELYEIGLSFNLRDGNGLIFRVEPFIVDDPPEDPTYLKQGLYVQVTGEFEDEIPYHCEYGYTEDPYADFWATLKILKTSKGFVVEREKKEDRIEGIDDSFYNWICDSIKEQFESCKICLLFLYPHIEALIK